MSASLSFADNIHFYSLENSSADIFINSSFIISSTASIFFHDFMTDTVMIAFTARSVKAVLAVRNHKIPEHS